MNPNFRKISTLFFVCIIVITILYIKTNRESKIAAILSENILTLPDTPPEKILTDTEVLTQNMTETFHDDFNTFNRYVDLKGNVTCNSGGIGTWQTVYHFCSRTNPANLEAEVYTDPGFLESLKKESKELSETDTDNPFKVNNGILTINAVPASKQVTTAVGSWAKYTSGMITTQFSFSQTYGYFEARMKIPQGKGLWPAFWLLPIDKTWPPEVDAMEAFGGSNTKQEGGLTMIHYASHALTKEGGCGKWYDTKINLSDDFHTYGVDIEPDGITYYLDGMKYSHCQENINTNKPFYMLINLAIGGEGSWPGIPDNTTIFPATLSIDYVRAYQKK